MKTVPRWKLERTKEIKRHILLVMSYIDIVLGFLEMFIAVYLNHNGISSDDSNVALYAILGLITILIGVGGEKYEEIDRARSQVTHAEQS